MLPCCALPCHCVAASQLPDDSSLWRARGHIGLVPRLLLMSLSAQSGEYQEETIRFGLECMYLDSWARQRTYQAFKEVLGSGIHHHLQVGAGQMHRGVLGWCWWVLTDPCFHRTMSCYGRSSASGPPWCWMRLL